MHPLRLLLLTPAIGCVFGVAATGLAMAGARGDRELATTWSFAALLVFVPLVSVLAMRTLRRRPGRLWHHACVLAFLIGSMRVVLGAIVAVRMLDRTAEIFFRLHLVAVVLGVFAWSFAAVFARLAAPWRGGPASLSVKDAGVASAASVFAIVLSLVYSGRDRAAFMGEFWPLPAEPRFDDAVFYEVQPATGTMLRGHGSAASVATISGRPGYFLAFVPGVRRVTRGEPAQLQVYVAGAGGEPELAFPIIVADLTPGQLSAIRIHGPSEPEIQAMVEAIDAMHARRWREGDAPGEVCVVALPSVKSVP